jgi:lysophospholipase L1-like esterase
MSRAKLRVTLLTASLGLNALLLLAPMAWVTQAGGWHDLAAKIPHRHPQEASLNPDLAAYLTRESIFEQLPPAPRDSLVFLGDSHIAGYEWGERFPKALNRGIGGDTTVGLLRRLPVIIRMSPRAVFLAIGHNDHINLGFTAQRSLANIRTIVDAIRRESPRTAIYLQSLVPSRNRTKTPPRLEISAGLKRMADGDKIRYVDFSAAFLKDGLLDERFTFDGEHLNAAGYDIWTRALQASAPELTP